MVSRQAKADRKKRNAKAISPKAEQPAEPKAPTPANLADALKRVRRRANAGDLRAREVLKTFLDAHPEIWSEVGNLARHAELALVEAASGNEWFTSEAIKREAARMRRTLAGSSPTPLETMAVERVVLTWLQLQFAEARFMETQRDLQWARYWLRRQEQADKLHRFAVKTLATIRELLPRIEAGQAKTAPIPRPSDVVDATVAETIGVESGSVNRIAGSVSSPDRARHVSDKDSTGTVPRLNGHCHRLEEMLAACEG